MIAYSSGRSKTFPVANSQWKSSISFLQKNIFNEKKKSPSSTPSHLSSRHLSGKFLEPKNMECSSKWAKPSNSCRWIFFTVTVQTKNLFHCQKNAERKICDLRDLFSKTHGFFLRWINESLAFLTFSPPRPQDQRRNPQSQPLPQQPRGQRPGEMVIFGEREAPTSQPASCWDQRYSPPAVHSPATYASEFQKKKHGPIWGTLGCHGFRACKKWVGRYFGGHTPLVRGSFSLNAAKSDW